MIPLGTVKPGSTIRIPFSSFDKDDGSSVTMTDYAVADILVYKDGGTTERASTSGFTATADFDSKTGKHLAVINLADNTTAGFFNAGSEYLVAIDAVTVDGVTTGGWIARFTIGYPSAVLDTTIATLSSQTSFTLTNGPAEDDALNGFWAIIHDIASAVQCSWVEVLDYTGSTKTVTLAAGATFTAAAGDNISLMGPSPLRAATTGRTAAIGTAGQIDANATQFGGTNGTFSGGRPEVNATHAAGTAWNSGAIGPNTLASDTITAAKLADGALTAAKFAAGAFDAVWTVASRTLTAFSTALAVSVWDVLASAVAAANSIGLQIKTNLDAALSTRASQTSVDDTPTVSEFNARTLASADYATASAQTTAQTSLTAIEAAIAALENLSQAESQAAAEAALTAFGAATAALFTTTTRNDPSALAGSLGSELTPFAKLDWLAARILRENTFNKDTGVLTVKNAAGTDIASSTCSDDATTTTRPQLGAP